MSQVKSKNIKAILWDNDGVLVDSERLYFEANRQVLAKLGLNLSAELFRENFLVKGIGAWHLLDPELTLTDLEVQRQARNRLYSELIRNSDVVIAGVKKTLEQLSNRFRMCVITSSRRDHFELLHKNSDLLRYFEFVLCSEDTKAIKPDPEPYIAGLKKLALNPAECLVIEDSERGLNAASAAGIKCWITPTEFSKGSNFSKADRVLESVTQIPLLLDLKL